RPPRPRRTTRCDRGRRAAAAACSFRSLAPRQLRRAYARNITDPFRCRFRTGSIDNAVRSVRLQPDREREMSGVRVLVGTRKGAFVLTSDGKRDRWDVSGPHFGGWEIYHLKGSPVAANRIYCS